MYGGLFCMPPQPVLLRHYWFADNFAIRVSADHETALRLLNNLDALMDWTNKPAFALKRCLPLWAFQMGA